MPIMTSLYKRRNSSFTAYPKYSKGAVFMSKKSFYGCVSSEDQAERGIIKLQHNTLLSLGNSPQFNCFCQMKGIYNITVF